MENSEISPIQMNLRSPTPTDRDSPRCMLRIPRVVTPDMLKVPDTRLPEINKGQSFSHSNSPLPLSPRMAKNKDIEFPDIRNKPHNDLIEINAKVIRGMKKHSSDKCIRMTKNDEENKIRFPTWINSQEELAKQGIFIHKNK